MLIEYEVPSAEIIDFFALERLASNRDLIEGRDETGRNGSGEVDKGSFTEDVEDW